MTRSAVCAGVSTMALALAVALGAMAAEGIGWPEAVSRFAAMRSKAETCVGLLKKYGDQAQTANGQLIYVGAKAEVDSLIAGLVVALSQSGAPDDLPNLDARSSRGLMGLADVCDAARALLPSAAGQKSFLPDIAKDAIQPLIVAVSDGVSALYNNHRKDDALTRLTIKTQLEAAKWPDYAQVKASD